MERCRELKKLQISHLIIGPLHTDCISSLLQYIYIYIYRLRLWSCVVMFPIVFVPALFACLCLYIYIYISFQLPGLVGVANRFIMDHNLWNCFQCIAFCCCCRGGTGMIPMRADVPFLSGNTRFRIRRVYPLSKESQKIVFVLRLLPFKCKTHKIQLIKEIKVAQDV